MMALSLRMWGRNDLNFPLMFDLPEISLTTCSFSGPLVRLYFKSSLTSKVGLNEGTMLMQRKFLVQVFAVKEGERDQYRSVIFPADRAMEGALFCEKWHQGESGVVQVLQRILHGTADVADVIGQAQSIQGWMGKLWLTDSEAALLGWRPELSGG
jgi:hypothetical protein